MHAASLKNALAAYSRHRYACRIFCRLLEFCGSRASAGKGRGSPALGPCLGFRVLKVEKLHGPSMCTGKLLLRNLRVVLCEDISPVPLRVPYGIEVGLGLAVSPMKHPLSELYFCRNIRGDLTLQLIDELLLDAEDTREG